MDDPAHKAPSTDMLELACAAMARAYAPYSRFPVGAVVRGESGALYPGCNVENAAFPQGSCAEASAISAMIMGGERHIIEVWLSSRDRHWFRRAAAAASGCMNLATMRRRYTFAMPMAGAAQ